MAENIVENILNKVDLFAPKLQQSIITDDFDQEYLPAISIQPGAPIEFSIESVDNFYLDLEKSRYIVRAKITKANGTDMDSARAVLVNLLVHSLFREISATVNDTSERPESTLSISGIPGDNFELLRGNSNYTQLHETVIRGLGKGHGKADGCNRSSKCEHRSERSRHSLRRERCNQARRSSAPRHISSKSDYTSKHYSAHKTNVFS